MKIIAGALKGRRLVTPRGDTTRPTADQVRIALMDTLTPRLPGARGRDVCAGGGGGGLEALSRGAAHATFVERDPRAVTALRANIEALGVGALTQVRRGDVLRELLLDPPYDSGLVESTLQSLGGGGLLLAEGLVVVQHFTKRAPGPVIGALASFRIRRFGETTLTFYRGAPGPG
jgi:16S rRNA (guanine966-N2)-methyltransferase